MARFKHEESLRAELQDARDELKDRKTIDRAKGILMQRQSLTEKEAYDRLRKLAMDKGIKMVQIAQRMIDAAELLG
ncbi:Nitrate regulatory protein [compost metagenome]